MTEAEIDLFTGESLRPRPALKAEESFVPAPVPEPKPASVIPEPANDIGVRLFGTDLFGETMEPAAAGKLSERFLIPPFSILNAREGIWQNRKRAWLSLGIKSELGRGAETFGSGKPGDLGTDFKAKENHAAPGGSARPACDYSNKERGDGAGKPIKKGKTNKLVPGGAGANSAWAGQRTEAVKEKYEDGNLDRKHGIGTTCDPFRHPGEPVDGASATGTSIFDPVLCELVYRWFMPQAGSIFDPFAGGSVRGIVASELGMQYTGIDLREVQIIANRDQAATICKKSHPVWVVGDSRNGLGLITEPSFDLVFSCPPYHDLEVYSDDPRDLSNCSWDEFGNGYHEIISAACRMLKPDRFAAFVVGDIRGKDGYYRGLPELTTKCFADAGMKLYNTAVLATAVGSLPIRTGRQFSTSRKLGNTHQYLLVYFKGNPANIKKQFPALDLEQ